MGILEFLGVIVMRRISTLAVRRLGALTLAMALVTPCNDPLLAGGSQYEVLRGPAKSFGEEQILYRIRQVALTQDYLFVLTMPEPAVHRFPLASEGSYQAWGLQGQGPAELEGPVSLALFEDEVWVLDPKIGNNKIVVYDQDGTFIETRSVDQIGFAGTLYSLGDRHLILGKNMGEATLSVLDLAQSKIILELPNSKAERVRLSAEGAPSLKVKLPGQSDPQWAPMSDRLYALWDGESNHIAVRRFQTETVEASLKLPPERIPFRKQDREEWFRRALPKVDLPGAGNDPFMRLRKAAQQSISFPSYFPPLEDMKPDSQDGVWILRGRVDEGSVWSWLRADQKPHTVVFPVGRSPMLFGDRFVVVKAVDELGVETLELYRRADVIRQE